MESQAILQNVTVSDLVERITKSVVSELSKSKEETQKKDEELLCRKESMKILKIGLSTFEKLYKSGQIQGCRIGNSLRFRRSDIVKYLESVEMKKYNK